MPSRIYGFNYRSCQSYQCGDRATEALWEADTDEATADDRMMAGNSKLIGEFLLGRDGIVRWIFLKCLRADGECWN